MVDRYGPAIEVDLHRMGLDLLDFFRGRHSWRKLHVLLMAAPRTSHFVAALANDPVYAEHVVALEEERRRRKLPEPTPRPALQEYTPEASRLDSVIDLLKVVAARLEQQITHKPGGRIQPQPRPETAVDRERDRARWDRHHALVDEVEAARARRRARAG